MKPLQHAKISAKRHGGVWQDYIILHNFFDLTKAHVADMRHRAILHNSFGIQLLALTYGEVRTNSDGKEYSVRDIGEEHVLQDLGTIPTLVEVINAIGTEHLKWLGGPAVNKRVMSWEDLEKKLDAIEVPEKAQTPEPLKEIITPVVAKKPKPVSLLDFIDGGGARYREQLNKKKIDPRVAIGGANLDDVRELIRKAEEVLAKKEPAKIEDEIEDSLPSAKIRGLFSD